jgi:hypothetical protein
MIVSAPGVGVSVGFALCPPRPNLCQTRLLLVRITPNGETMPGGGLARPDVASELLMYISAAS